MLEILEQKLFDKSSLIRLFTPRTGPFHDIRTLPCMYRFSMLLFEKRIFGMSYPSPLLFKYKVLRFCGMGIV